jgi:hypothetical protein
MTALTRTADPCRSLQIATGKVGWRPEDAKAQEAFLAEAVRISVRLRRIPADLLVALINATACRSNTDQARVTPATSTVKS